MNIDGSVIKNQLKKQFRGMRRVVELQRALVTRKPIILIYGNCQAAVLSAILRRGSSGAGDFFIVKVPGVHEIPIALVPLLHEVVSRTDFFIYQQVRNNYRGVSLGSQQLMDMLPVGSRSISYPSIYFDGYHPFSVYVHVSGDVGTPAPLVEYHDIRFLFAAKMGIRGSDALDWLKSYELAPDLTRARFESSMTKLVKREEALDIAASPIITRYGVDALHTLNHPSNAVLYDIASQIADRVPGLGELLRDDQIPEYLGHVRAPVEGSVRTALQVSGDGDERNWIVGDTKISTEDLMIRHLDWYGLNPEILSAGSLEHQNRFADAGLE